MFTSVIRTKNFHSSSINHLALECCDKMALLYSAANLAMCKSGGSTIAELIFFEKPAILIPYPLAADLHQNDNAYFYTKSGLPEIVFNKDCTEIKMKHVISKFIAEPRDRLTDSLILSKNSEATDEIIEQVTKKVAI